jgi:SAM-dependent methyltransferase
VKTDEPPDWARALGQLDELQRAATTAALLRNAHRSGLLRAVVDGPADAATLAGGLGLPEPRVSAALQVLAAHGIAGEEPDGTWRLAPGWDELVRGESPLSLAGSLDLGRVWAEQFAVALDSGLDYWQLDPSDRLGVAAGISPDPRAAATVAMARGLVESLPGMPDALEAGGRVLELGCGLASRLCALLQAYPQARAVGIELDAALVAAARTRAEEVGVADRLDLVVGDAATYDGRSGFALANWSQFFFPEASRAATLAAAYAALQPDGWISMPVVWDGTPPPAQTPEDRELAEMRLVLDLWDVPMRTVGEVEAEVKAAGFVDVHGQPAPGFHVVRGRRP